MLVENVNHQVQYPNELLKKKVFGKNTLTRNNLKR